MNYPKLITLFGFLALLITPMRAQFVTASEVESWVNPDFPSADFNLNSAYVYLINGNVLRDVFAGEELNRSQRKEVGLAKGDYPQYMYLAVSIPDPTNDQNAFTIPLMVQDIQDPNNTSRLMGYGGRVLENIPDEVLKKGDIVAKVKFEAIKGNSTEEFWKKTAKISIELGKTATSLLAAPLTGSFSLLTQQIVPQVSKGLSSLEKADESPQKISSEFYIRLMDKQLSALYQERVVGATLYKIHWDVGGQPPRSSFFRNAHPSSVEDIKRLVTHNTSAYILVVHTKSEYNTDHSELVYNQSYIEKKTKDYRKIQNAEKKEIEKEFLETLKLAIELKNQIDIFQNSLNGKYPDWLAYSKIIDLYFDIRRQKSQQEKRLVTTADPVVRQNYSRLYTNMITDVDLWFSTDLLGRARGVAEYLVGASVDYDYSYVAPSMLYRDIELLDFYRDRVKQIEIQGKLPKEIEALETFALTNRLLANLEGTLFDKEFRVPPTLNPEDQKRWLLDRATNRYPLCRACSKGVGDRISEIENLTHEQNILKYRQISAEYYQRLSCMEEAYARLDSIIQANANTPTMAPFLLQELKKDKAELDKLADTYTDIVGRDYTAMTRSELADLLSRYYVTRDKMTAVMERLRSFIQQGGRSNCLP